MYIDRIIFIGLLAMILDNMNIYLNYSLTTLFLFINLVGLYLFITNIHINLNIRYGID